MPAVWDAARSSQSNCKGARVKKIRVGILGATGAVGQRFVQLLEGHPWFEVTALAASDNSAGKQFGEAVRWKLSADVPAYARAMNVQPCQPALDCDLVFSGLPSDVAGPIEEDFARAGYVVSSNARNHRLDSDVPLLVPEINPDHLDILPMQRKKRGYGRGCLVTNPNCSTIHLVLALKPLQDAFGLEKVLVTTLQALSGAGYPGVPSLDIVDNVVPFIGGEEEKLESEPLKIMGSYTAEHFDPASFTVSAHCNRVATIDAHLECVSVSLARHAPLQEVSQTLAAFSALPQKLSLPSAPTHPVVVRSEPDRPQPRLDRDTEKGMATVVGRLRPCNILDYRFVLLGHNTIRGAAGAAILNAELMLARGDLAHLA
jgi:aspartate-semialdehyde dehydrogenase